MRKPDKVTQLFKLCVSLLYMLDFFNLFPRVTCIYAKLQNVIKIILNPFAQRVSPGSGVMIQMIRKPQDKIIYLLVVEDTPVRQAKLFISSW